MIKSLFHSKLAVNLDRQKRRVKENFASMIIIDGEIGQGKTTLAVEVADYINGKPIIFNEQLAVGGEDFQKKLLICAGKKHSVIIYDEAGDFSKFGSLSKFNYVMNRIFDTYRVYKVIVIMVLPSFNALDRSMFDKGIPRGLIHCYGRNQKRGKFASFKLKKMWYLKEKIAKWTVKSAVYSTEIPNFYGWFKNLPLKRSKELYKHTMSGKKDILQFLEIQNKGLVTMDHIGQSLGYSKIWVRNKLTSLKIKPIQKIKNKNYYDKGVINRLQNNEV